MEIVFEQRRWMDIVIEQWRSLEEAKQKKARAGCRNLSSTTTASQPKKADIIQCALSIFAGGASGTRWRGECLMKCLSQDVKASCSHAACEFSFYKGALRAVSLALWQLWDGDGWSWSSTYCHFQRILLKGLCTEHAYESLRHGSPQAGLFLFALRVVLPFVVYFKELGN